MRKRLIPIRISEELKKQAEERAIVKNQSPSEFYRDAVAFYTGLGDPTIMVNVKHVSQKLGIDEPLFVEIAILRFCAEIFAKWGVDGLYEKTLPEFIMTAEGWLRGQNLLTKLTEEYQLRFREDKISTDLRRNEH